MACKKIKKIKGAGLLEIMISLLISGILLAEIFRYSYYLENMLNFSATKVDSIEKINVLFAWMVRDIEMAGYVGCVNAYSRDKIIDDGHYLSSTWLIANGNILQSQYMSPKQFKIIEKINETEILILGNNHLNEEDIVFIENCWQAEVIKIKKIHSVNHGEKTILEFYLPFKTENISNTYVAKLIQHDYSIKNLGIYVKNESGDSNEILENISSFNIKSSQGKYYISANKFNDADEITLSASAYNAS